MAILYVGSSSDSLTEIPLDPSEMTWGLSDISDADAGRTQAGTMYKMLVTRKRKLTLTWAYPTVSQVAAILQLFDSEYFYVKYLDWQTGSWETRYFYRGDVSSPVKWQNNGRTDRATSLSFDIIEV